jgi:NAD dependent epimerase/dehydratase family
MAGISERSEAPMDIVSTAELENVLSVPTPEVVAMFSRLTGDVIVLGVGGKMGPTLAYMAKRAIEEAGTSSRVIGVSRFSNPAEKQKLEAWGIKTIAGDLMDAALIDSLPDSEQVVFMAGMKFGATGNESLTWAMNTLLPAGICRRYAKSRITAFSTGNVYGLVPLHSGGSIETDTPNPKGEYAMSCLGRERTFEYFSKIQGTKISLLRLNYACELRYGVLVDLAIKIKRGETIDLSMPMANVIWQRDANVQALLSLEYADDPPFILNIAGPEQISVRRVCEQLGALLDKPATFSGQEQSEAILNNGQKGHRLFGYPTRSINTVIRYVAQWVKQDGEMIGKPTKFEVCDGKF